jgi:hypothetical protein
MAGGAEVLGAQHAGALGPRPQHGQLHRVAELADVAEPAATLQQRTRLDAQLGRGDAQAASHLAHQRTRQQGHVFAARVQRRQLDLHHSQPVVEVTAQLLGLGAARHVRVGGGHDAHVRAARRVVAQAVVRARLREVQQLGLSRAGQLRDLVQEQRAPLGRRHQAQRAPSWRWSARPGWRRTARSRSARSATRRS